MVKRPYKEPENKINLNDLFLSVQGQLLEKIHMTRKFVPHRGSKGAAAEQAWLLLLRSYLPERYKIDSAFVVDSEGNLSDQIDIVIYDRQYSPLIFQQEGVLYVPAESVYAVFDVKHVLGQTQLNQSAEKAASVRALKRTSVPIQSAGGILEAKAPIEITAGILALENLWSDGYVSKDAHKFLTELPPNQRINIGCSIRHGAFELVCENQTLRLQESSRDKALIFFLLRLLHRLQQVGTVPAIDILKYAQVLQRSS